MSRPPKKIKSAVPTPEERIAQLEAELEKLKAALEWYANESRWATEWDWGFDGIDEVRAESKSYAQIDKGYLARQALGKEQ